MNSAMATEVFAEGRHPALLLILRGEDLHLPHAVVFVLGLSHVELFL